MSSMMASPSRRNVGIDEVNGLPRSPKVSKGRVDDIKDASRKNVSVVLILTTAITKLTTPINAW
jgi:hypothetical protein